MLNEPKTVPIILKLRQHNWEKPSQLAGIVGMRNRYSFNLWYIGVVGRRVFGLTTRQQNFVTAGKSREIVMLSTVLTH